MSRSHLTERRIVPMHNEPEALRELQALSLNARHHISHILRNGLCCIMAVGSKKVSDEVMRLEEQIKEMGF